MDNRLHFKAKSPVGQIKQMISNEQKKNYYSEESGGDSPDSMQQNKTVTLKGMIKAEYQTDDSDSTP